MEQVAFDAPWLRSHECERAVTSALINEPGVRWATAAASSGVVVVQYDPAVTALAELRDAVDAVGHGATA